MIRNSILTTMIFITVACTSQQLKPTSVAQIAHTAIPTNTIGTPTYTNTPTPTPTLFPTPTPIAGKDVRVAFIGGEPFGSTYLYVGSIYTEDFVPIAPINNIPDSFPYAGTSLSWSPEGTHIAYVDWGDENNFLNIIDIETGQIQELVTLSQDEWVTNISWAFNGDSFIVYELASENNRNLNQSIFLLDIEKGQTYNIGNNIEFSGWNTEIPTFFYYEGGKAWKYNALNKSRLPIRAPRISSKVNLEDTQVQLASFSYDGYFPGLDAYLLSGTLRETTSEYYEGLYLVFNDGRSSIEVLQIPQELTIGTHFLSTRIVSPDANIMYVGGQKSFITNFQTGETFKIYDDTSWMLGWDKDNSFLVIATNMEGGLTINLIEPTSGKEVYSYSFVGSIQPSIKVFNQLFQKSSALDVIVLDQGSSVQIAEFIPPPPTITPTQDPLITPTPTSIPIPESNQILFYADGDIYLMNIDGPDKVNLTNSLSTESLPSWSPNGKLIAFASDRTGENEVYVMNADGSGVKQLSEFPDLGAYYIRSWYWTPDEKQLVFAAAFYGGENTHCPVDKVYTQWNGLELCTTNCIVGFGGNEDPICNIELDSDVIRSRNYLQTTSPDGKFIFFIQGENFPAWFNSADEEKFPEWFDPDFQGPSFPVVCIRPINSSGCIQLPFSHENISDNIGRIYFNSWSPDSKKILVDLSYYDGETRYGKTEFGVFYIYENRFERLSDNPGASGAAEWRPQVLP